MSRWMWVLPFALLAGARIEAQDVSDETTSPAPAAKQDLWVSLGLGAGGPGIAAVGSGWFAYDRWVVGARVADARGWSGPDVHDKAALVGLRTRERHHFALISAGPAIIGGWRSNGEDSGTRTVYPDELGIAGGAEAAFTLNVIGIGLDAFGAAGRRSSYFGIALSLQLGYLR